MDVTETALIAVELQPEPVPAKAIADPVEPDVAIGGQGVAGLVVPDGVGLEDVARTPHFGLPCSCDVPVDFAAKLLSEYQNGRLLQREARQGLLQPWTGLQNQRPACRGNSRGRLRAGRPGRDQCHAGQQGPDMQRLQRCGGSRLLKGRRHCSREGSLEKNGLLHTGANVPFFSRSRGGAHRGVSVGWRSAVPQAGNRREAIWNALLRM